MPAIKLSKTKHEGIFKYEIKKGVRYAIRLRYQDSNLGWKERQEQGFETITEAKKRKVELQNEINNDLASTFKGDQITFKEWYDKYYALMSPNWSTGNKRQCQNMYNWYLSELDNIILSNVSLMKYQHFINSKLEILSRGTVDQIHGRMMAIINSAVSHEVLKKNKLRDVVIQKSTPHKQKNLPDSLIKQFDLLAKTELCTIRYACYVLMRYGAWRRSESLGVIEKSIKKLNDNMIAVTMLETKTQYEDKGKPKTDSSERTSILTGANANAILDAVELARKIHELHGMPFTENSRIIINMKTGKTFGYNEPNRILERLSKKLELSEKVTPHMLRHTFASSGVNDNMIPLEEMKNWLGHSDIRTTLRYVGSTEKSREQIVTYANAQ